LGGFGGFAQRFKPGTGHDTRQRIRRGDKKGQLTLPFFAASLPARAGDEAGITSLLPCR
jgi:hypothetical protein